MRETEPQFWKIAVDFERPPRGVNSVKFCAKFVLTSTVLRPQRSSRVLFRLRPVPSITPPFGSSSFYYFDRFDELAKSKWLSFHMGFLARVEIDEAKGGAGTGKTQNRIERNAKMAEKFSIIIFAAGAIVRRRHG